MLDFVQKIVAKMTKRRIRRKKGSRRLSRLKTAAAWPEIIGGGGVRRRRAALMEAVLKFQLTHLTSRPGLLRQCTFGPQAGSTEICSLRTAQSIIVYIFKC